MKMFFKVESLLLIVSIMVSSLFALAEESVLTNDDIITLVQSGFSDEVIIASIESKPTNFRTSVNDLISLKESNVPESVLKAMISSGRDSLASPETDAAQKDNQPVNPAPVSGSGSYGSRFNYKAVDAVTLIDGEDLHSLKMTIPGSRTAIRPFGGLMQKYAVIPGDKASLRVKSKSPKFDLILPKNIQPQSVVSLALLGVRKNGSREILVGASAVGNFASGIPGDRNIKLDFVENNDQAGVPENYIRYKIAPQNDLIKGEYAFVISRPPQGFEMAFFAASSAAYNFYEFGVDQ